MKTVTTTPCLPPARRQPWTDYLTFDLIGQILGRSVFHPFICFLIPLCLLATHRPAASPSIRYTFWWACLVTLYHTLAIWNHRFAYGRARTVKLKQEVVLVAGGGGTGLGSLIAEVYAMKGARGVAVLDINVPEPGPEREEWEERGIRWFECDLGRQEEVEQVKTQIVEEFDMPPTILINCVAGPIASSPITALQLPRITATLTTNLTSHYNLLSVFLPHLLQPIQPSNGGSGGGTIVTVSSILAHFSPAYLSPYSASKAALSSLHHSLAAEIRNLRLSHRVKSILVEPGQIDTSLFAGVETPSHFLAPVLDTREVCKAITALVDAGEAGVLRMPQYAAWVEWYHVLPVSLQRLVRWASRVDVSMRRAGAGEKKSEVQQQQQQPPPAPVEQEEKMKKQTMMGDSAQRYGSEVKDQDQDQISKSESASSDDLVVVNNNNNNNNNNM